MIIGVKELLKLVNKDHLVSGLADRELKDPEGAGFDLRLGEVHKLVGSGYLGIIERKTPDAKLIYKYSSKKKQVFKLFPGQQYLVSTIEEVSLPKSLTANFWLRSTLYRSGVILSGGNVAPGYTGKLSFTLFNSGKSKIEIELGARIIHILFYEVKGGGSLYRGQWKGGRVVARKKEKQV